MQQEVPGLYLFNDFFNRSLCQSIIEASLTIHKKLEDSLEDNKASNLSSSSATIPQPDFVKSEKHNLTSEEQFVRVAIEDSKGKTIKAEYFPRYGEEGHALAYFRGNDNLPQLAHELLPKIRELIASKHIITEDLDDSWRLTMNFYKNVAGVVSGFPFHVDIPANGVITMILNVHREATFQITDGNKVIDLLLPIGALLILSGESRYKWKHRVLPSEDASKIENRVARISLVLGVK